SIVRRYFFFSSRRRHTRSDRDWSSDVCSSDLETWLSLDENKLYAEWNGRVDRIRKLVETVPGVRTDIFIPQDGNRYPTVRVYWRSEERRVGKECRSWWCS